MSRKSGKPITWESANDFLTAKEAAELLRISVSAVYAAVRLNLIPARNLGKRQTRISKLALKKAFSIPGIRAATTAAFAIGGLTT